MQLKKPLTLLLTIVCWSYFSLTPIQAQTPYPNKSIRLIVVAPPGGTLDSVSRAFATTLAEGLEQSVVVENRAGAGGSVGAAEVAAARPDGYTLGMIYDTHAVNQHLYKNLRYDTFKSFDYVSRIVTSPQILVAAAAFPASNVSEFIRYVKANPGKVNYGSAGSGSLQHISGALFEKMIQGSMVHIPYKGGALANSDLVAGRVHVVFGPIVELMPFVSSGAIRVLGVTSLTRSASFPDAHPVAEVVPGYEMSTWHGVFAPKGTNPEIVDVMNKAINAVLADPPTRTRLIALGLDPVKSTQQEFTKFYFDEIKRWKELVNIAGAKQE